MFMNKNFEGWSDAMKFCAIYILVCFIQLFFFRVFIKHPITDQQTLQKINGLIKILFFHSCVLLFFFFLITYIDSSDSFYQRSSITFIKKIFLFKKLDKICFFPNFFFLLQKIRFISVQKINNLEVCKQSLWCT